MKMNHTLALAGGILCSLLPMAQVRAGDTWNSYDRKVMSGAQCQPSTGSQWGDFIVNPEGIRNIATPASAKRYVSCALIFDSENAINTSDTDPATAAGTIWVAIGLDYSTVPSTSSPGTQCTLIRRSYNGTRTTAAFPGIEVQGGTAGTHEAFLPSPSILNGMNIGSPDTFSVNCNLPPQVRLTYVKTYEHGETGHYRYVPPAP